MCPDACPLWLLLQVAELNQPVIEHSVSTYSTVHAIFAYLPEPVQLSLIMMELTWLHI